MTPTPLAARRALALFTMLTMGALSIADTAGAEEQHLAMMLQNDVFAGADGGNMLSSVPTAGATRRCRSRCKTPVR